VTDVQTDSEPAPPSSRRSRRGLWIGLVALVLVAAAAFAVWYFVFRDTAPPKVDINTASEAVKEDKASATTSPDTSDAGANLDGTWTIDNSIGQFDTGSETYTSAFVGYRVNEELAGVGAKTAFGRTPDVTGTLTLDGTTATAAEFTADLTTLQSDDARRDGQLSNQSIQTSQFPTATFTLTEPIEFGTIPADESTVSVDATGELTLHGVTKTVTIPLEAKLVNNTIVVTSLFDITFADFNITKPSSAAVLSVEDKGIMEVQLFFTKS
jgi:polyisoprenoid-binding protein YceI